MNANTFESRILAPITLALALLLGAFIYNIHHTQKQEISKSVTEQIALGHRLFEKQLVSDGQAMSATIEIISKNPKIQEAWLAKDRESLLELTAPLFATLKQRSKITHFYFHDTNRVNFFRAHKPEKQGDIISRFTILQAAKSGQAFSGVELGPLGTLTLRTVYPWRIDGQLTGYIELGKELDYIIHRVREILGLELCVIIHKDFLVREQWEEGMRMLERDNHWDDFPESVVISRTPKWLAKAIGGFLPEDKHQHMYMTGKLELPVENMNYRIGAFPLMDVAGNDLGDIFVLYDITEQLASSSKTVLITAMICVIVGTALLILFALILGKAEREVEDSETKLVGISENLKIKTKDLEAANKLLQNEIQEHKQIQTQLKQIMAELKHSNMELQQFAYIASHDLQEPLRKVQTYMELLAHRYQGKLDEKADKFIVHTVGSVTIMQTLIKSLLKYSQTGNMELPLEKIDMGDVVNQAIANLDTAIRENKAKITYDSLPTVTANNLQLTQLLQNLISNAIKFHDDRPPQVHISAERKNGNWIFGVRDNGIGIEKEYLDQIFIAFKRLHSRTHYDGTGIGLAICKKIVQRHGGHIWVESPEPGKGATFYFTIPVNTEES